MYTVAWVREVIAASRGSSIAARSIDYPALVSVVDGDTPPPEETG